MMTLDPNLRAANSMESTAHEEPSVTIKLLRAPNISAISRSATAITPSGSSRQSEKDNSVISRAASLNKENILRFA